VIGARREHTDQRWIQKQVPEYRQHNPQRLSLTQLLIQFNPYQLNRENAHFCGASLGVKKVDLKR
jgi:hypothetical protein